MAVEWKSFYAKGSIEVDAQLNRFGKDGFDLMELVSIGETGEVLVVMKKTTVNRDILDGSLLVGHIEIALAKVHELAANPIVLNAEPSMVQDLIRQLTDLIVGLRPAKGHRYERMNDA